MSSMQHLSGSCNCGRYNYVVLLPDNENVKSEAQVHFGTGSEDRRSQASLLSAWLRVPLEWFHSATVSFFDDEHHDLIQRTFTPLHEPNTQRKFCGFCGTHISYWTESPQEERDYMNITLGSLRRRDIEALEQMDLLPEDLEEMVSKSVVPGSRSGAASKTTEQSVVPSEGYVKSSRHGTDDGVSWFEDIIEGSRLGYHSKRRRGQGRSADGSTVVQWEVSEFMEGDDDDDGEENNTSDSKKRKAADIASDDTPMRD